MYNIKKSEGCIQVWFESDFDMNTMRALVHHLMTLKEFHSTNDIWMIGSYRAAIHLGEIDELVYEYTGHCPKYTERTKTAIVVKRGLTQAILELWVNAIRHYVDFEVKLFDSRAGAEEWLGVGESLELAV